MPVSLLVIAAHPDDEVIGAARLLLRARSAAVVHLTDGAPRDPLLRPSARGDREEYARARRREALDALAIAGLAAEDEIGLGAVDQEAVLALPSLASELVRVVRALRPRVVNTHPWEGGHPDHDAAAIVARAAAALLGRAGARAPPLAEMASYHRRGGLLETGAFLPGGPPGVARPLSPEEQAAKRRMLDAHVSQREVLAPFGVAVERYRRAPPLDVRARPHPGVLHYEALGWTTFERFRERARAGLRALELGDAPWA